MSKIEIRKVTSSDLDDLRWMAEMHERAPLVWDENYRVTASAIEARFAELRKCHERSLMLVACMGPERVGYHWVTLEKNNELTFGHVKGLWVHERHRSQGIARRMKGQAEDWCVNEECAYMKTTVHFTNRTMLEWNLRWGYKPGFVEMHKPLLP